MRESDDFLNKMFEKQSRKAANRRKQLDDLLLQSGQQFPINKDCSFYGPKGNNCTILKMDYCCYERKCNFFKNGVTKNGKNN